MVSESDEITGGSMSEDSPEVVGDTCINSTNNPSVSRLGNLCFNGNVLETGSTGLKQLYRDSQKQRS